MKNFSYNAAALLIASAAAFTACTSEEPPVAEQPAQQVYIMAISASIGEGSAVTRALAVEGTTLTATWKPDENVYVKKGETWLSGSLNPDADAATAVLKGTLTGTTLAANNALTLQFPKSGDITYAGQVGTLADIAANFDYATASVTVKEISSQNNIVPTAATTTFTNQQAIVKFTLQNGGGTALSNPTALKINDGSSDVVTLTSIPSETYTTNGSNNVLYMAVPAISEKTVTLTATVSGVNYSTTKASVTFDNGKYYTVTAKMKATPTVTAPTANSLTYTGSAQALVNAGSTSGGTLQYKLGSGEYSTTIPTATNAGTYTVYYKVVGGDNYEDVAEQNISVTINKATGSISYGTTAVSKTTDDAAFTNALTKTGDGTVSYASNATDVATVNASTGEVTIVGAGTATITATVTDGTNYTYATKTATYTLTVSKAGVTSDRTGYDAGGSSTW